RRQLEVAQVGSHDPYTRDMILCELSWQRKEDRARRRLHGRLAQAPGLGGLCLVRARPGGTRIAEEAQRAIRGGPELKTPAGRDDDSVARSHLDRLGASAGRAAPHLTAPSADVPDLLHRAG